MLSAVVRKVSPRLRSVSKQVSHRWLALAVVLTAAFVGTLDFFIVNLAMPSIQADLGATDAGVQLVIACYGLAFAVCLITGGRLGDVYGRKRCFLLGLLGFTLTSGLCGLAWSPGMLIAARVIQGVTGALMFPQVLSIVQVTFPPHERGPAFSAFGAVQGAASLLGLIVGGLLVKANLFNLGWRPIFLVNLPVGLVTYLAGLRFLPESRSPRAVGMDFGGVVLASVGLFLIVFPLAEGREVGWPNWAFVCLAATVPVLVAFLLLERFIEQRGGSPLVELHLFSQRAFVFGLLTSIAFYAGLAGFFLGMTLYFQRGLGLSAAMAGLAFSPFAIGFFAGSTFGARMARPLGVRILNLGAAVMAIGVLAVLTLLLTHSGVVGPWAMLPALLIYGIGQGLISPPLTRAVLSAVPPSDAGSASGVLGTAQQVAGAIGVTAVTGVFFSTYAVSSDYAVALRVSLMCNLALLALTFVLAFALPRSALANTPVTTHDL